jgi:membrane protease subunit (stomatin/prohibitin family)
MSWCLILFSVLARGAGSFLEAIVIRARINATDFHCTTIKATCRNFMQLIIYNSIIVRFVSNGKIVDYSTDKATEILQICICGA